MKHGSLETICWVLKRRSDRVCPRDRHAACTACVARHLRLLGPEVTARVLHALQGEGHPVATQLGTEWNRDPGPHTKVLTPVDLIKIIRYGDLAAVRRLVDRHSIRIESRPLKIAILQAAASGYDAVVQLVLAADIADSVAHEFEWTNVGSTDAKVLRCHDRTLFKIAVSCAISAGNLPMLRLLHDQHPANVSSVAYYYSDGSRWTSSQTEDAILLVYDWAVDDDFTWWSSGAMN